MPADVAVHEPGTRVVHDESKHEPATFREESSIATARVVEAKSVGGAVEGAGAGAQDPEVVTVEMDRVRQEGRASFLDDPVGPGGVGTVKFVEVELAWEVVGLLIKNILQSRLGPIDVHAAGVDEPGDEVLILAGQRAEGEVKLAQAGDEGSAGNGTRPEGSGWFVVAVLVEGSTGRVGAIDDRSGGVVQDTAGNDRSVADSFGVVDQRDTTVCAAGADTHPVVTGSLGGVEDDVVALADVERHLSEAFPGNSWYEIGCNNIERMSVHGEGEGMVHSSVDKAKLVGLVLLDTVPLVSNRLYNMYVSQI